MNRIINHNNPPVKRKIINQSDKHKISHVFAKSPKSIKLSDGMDEWNIFIYTACTMK